MARALYGLRRTSAANAWRPRRSPRLSSPVVDLRSTVIFSLALLSCGPPPPIAEAPAPEAEEEVVAAPREVTLTIIGTNDLHGHVHALPILAGYLRIVRE